MNKKALIIILDGLGDRPIADFNGLTPLEKASTPFFDKLASKGMCAMVHPLTTAVPVSTHTGMALLMGLAPKNAADLERGPVEAASFNSSARQGDVFVRCNFAHIIKEQDELKVLDRRAGRINQQTEILAQALNDIDLPYGIKATFHSATQHRIVLHLKGKKLSAQISDTDCVQTVPTYVKTCKPLIDNRQASQSAEVINIITRKAHQILASHAVNRQRVEQGKIPATGIICRGAGEVQSVQNILNYYKLKVAVVSAEATVIGLTNLFGFTNITRPEFTALADTDIKTKVKLAEDALQQNDIVYIHFKGTDICSHDKQALEKAQFIGKIDEALATISIKDRVIAVTGDHSTNSYTGFHCGDPVPSILYAPGGRVDRSVSYSEQECMYGGLGQLSGSAFLLSILDQMNYLHNFKNEDIDYL